jgi:hypothetical protein
VAASALEAATMREQLALSMFRAEKAAKDSAEAQLEAARQEIAPSPALTLTRHQAMYVRHALRERDMPDHACRLCVGEQASTDDFVCVLHVIDHWLTHAPESAEAQGDALRQQIAEWRSWAQFVYGGGGPAPEGATDANMRLKVCEAHDAEMNRLRAKNAKLEAQVDALTRAQAEVWIVRQGDGLRGVHRSQRGAEDEIAAICREHPDLSRRDFIVQVERIR